MTRVFQASLLDIPGIAPSLGSLTGSVWRTRLAQGAWVDFLPSWVNNSDELFLRLLESAPWRAERREMYERFVDVPRLQAFYGESETLPDPLLDEARDALSRHYADDLPEPFTTAGVCLYRDGRDSVAWHGDTIGRTKPRNTMVAIISLGDPRRLMLRPRGGGESIAFALGRGDLLVMGGSCQQTWEHAVPKTARPVGPRISVQFRPPGLR